MSTIEINGLSNVGTSLTQMLTCDDIQPGSAPSYQTCKTIYAYHPLGAKIVEKPITLAQSKAREISVTKAPDAAKEEFLKKWKEVGADAHIFNLMRLSRVYGIASMALLINGVEGKEPVDWPELHTKTYSINVFDPLNTAGSLVLNQQPNSMDFMKTTGWLTVSGANYHPSRTIVMMNEDPLYIEYTTSAFGFVGRSVYQRALFPLKSFIATMRTNDLVALKAGVIVAKLAQPGSIGDKIIGIMMALKRQVIKEAQTYNVINVGQNDVIESMNFQNMDGPLKLIRTNILEDIAAAADDMPAILLNQETFAQGFGEGSEDAKMVGRYVDRIREKMQPAYDFFDKMVQHLTWTPEFYKTIQATNSDLKGVDYKTAFMDWTSSFKAAWPPFLDEPPSEQVKVDDVKLKAVIAMLQVLLPIMDPANRLLLVQWACDNFNELKLLFGSHLEFDYDALLAYAVDQEAQKQEALKEPPASKPFAANDSVAENALIAYDEAVKMLLDSIEARTGAKLARPNLRVAR